MAARGFRVLPTRIKMRLKSLPGKLVEVGCVRQIKVSDIRPGKYGHVGLRIRGGRVVVSETPIVPPGEIGKFSDRNANGYEVVRKDLPKETHYNYIETPNWGDWSRGTHIVAMPYEKYPRDMYAPRLAGIRATVVGTSADETTCTIQFRTTDVLDRKSSNFEEDLLEVLNFLNENVGCYGVERHDAPLGEYLKQLLVSWEILPPGSRDEVVARLFRGRAATPEEIDIVEERYPFLMSLKPEKIIIGTSGMERYLGAMITENRVVFENLRYGNAAYVMYDNWKELSQRNRIELLSGRYGRNFVRIVHAKGWKQQVKSALLRPPTEPPPMRPRHRMLGIPRQPGRRFR